MEVSWNGGAPIAGCVVENPWMDDLGFRAAVLNLFRSKDTRKQVTSSRSSGHRVDDWNKCTTVSVAGTSNGHTCPCDTFLPHSIEHHIFETTNYMMLVCFIVCCNSDRFCCKNPSHSWSGVGNVQQNIVTNDFSYASHDLFELVWKLWQSDLQRGVAGVQDIYIYIYIYIYKDR